MWIMISDLRSADHKSFEVLWDECAKNREETKL